MRTSFFQDNPSSPLEMEPDDRFVEQGKSNPCPVESDEAENCPSPHSLARIIQEPEAEAPQAMQGSQFPPFHVAYRVCDNHGVAFSGDPTQRVFEKVAGVSFV